VGHIDEFGTLDLES